jgi:hypothetical protein
LAKWEAEFNQLMNAQRDELDYDYGSVMQEAWENGQKEITETAPGDKPLQFGDDGLPILEPYTFGILIVSPVNPSLISVDRTGEQVSGPICF